VPPARRDFCGQRREPFRKMVGQNTLSKRKQAHSRRQDVKTEAARKEASLGNGVTSRGESARCGTDQRSNNWRGLRVGRAGSRRGERSWPRRCRHAQNEKVTKGGAPGCEASWGRARPAAEPGGGSGGCGIERATARSQNTGHRQQG